MKNFAVILASGNAVRMSGIDKMIGLVAGKPLVSFSIEAFLNFKTFDQIYVTVNDSNEAVIKEIVRGYSSIDNDIVVIPGGIRRQDSVKNALNMVLDANIVAVHDGARPLLTEKIILEGAQSGLSWITILKKRENYRRLFDGFDPGIGDPFDIILAKLGLKQTF